MALNERPGLFSGIKYNRQAWYVVDPTTAEGAIRSAEAWRLRWAPTNTRKGTRVLARILGWTIIVIGIAVGSILGSLVLQVVPSAYFGAICLGLGGFIGGGLLGLKLYSRIVPRHVPNGPKVAGVIPLVDELRDWERANEVPTADLWALNLSLTQVQQVRSVFEGWGPWHEDGISEYPTWALENVVEPVLRTELADRQRELAVIAARAGFQIPDSVTAPPLSFSRLDDD